ncbi:DNA cytosine methyltransferase [bacterium]|nr:DNA cytosine methyltransferase [bacterium]
MKNKTFNAIDLFSGCGGLSEGLKQAGFDVVAGIEIDKNAARTYKMNHPETLLFEDDIRKPDAKEILNLLNGKPLHLLAGCPPCQGFSSLRKLNRKASVRDERNGLIGEYYRFVEELKPLTIMLENVPGLVDYTLFKKIVNKLKKQGYDIACKIVDVSGYGVPQRRKRLVLVGSRLGKIDIVLGNNTGETVRNALGRLESVEKTKDKLHQIFPRHTARIQKMISLIPKDGGSRKDLPEKYKLKCHQKENVGFNDVYGRLSWDKVSSTITGGCLNPSKGRYLHPEENRCITAREAALLQTFPVDYKFPTDIPRAELALLIGNALPPKFSRIQAENIFSHIGKCYG